MTLVYTVNRETSDIKAYVLQEKSKRRKKEKKRLLLVFRLFAAKTITSAAPFPLAPIFIQFS
jgi:hypothetical protein